MDQQKWNTLSLVQQVGNIGSELSRAQYWEQKKETVQRGQALGRALELIDLTLGTGQPVVRLRELARLREMVGAWYCRDQSYCVSPRAIEDFCLQLALIARQ